MVLGFIAETKYLSEAKERRKDVFWLMVGWDDGMPSITVGQGRDGVESVAVEPVAEAPPIPGDQGADS